MFQHRLAMCTCSIASLPNADVIKNHLNMMEPGTGLGMVDHVAGGLPGGRGIVRRLSSSMGPNGASIAEESIGHASEASASDGQVRHVKNILYSNFTQPTSNLLDEI